MNKIFGKQTIFDSVVFSYLMTVFLAYSGQHDALTSESIVKHAIIFLILFLLGGVLSLVLNKMGMKTWGELIFEPAYKKAQGTDRSWYKSLWGWQILITLFVTCAVGVEQTHFSFIELLDQDGFEGAKKLAKGVLTPNWSVLPKAIRTMIETIYMAFMATALAVPVAFVLCFFASKNIMKHPLAFGVYFLLRLLLNFARSIEAMIWAIIFSVWVGIGPFAGMMALMIHSVASLVKQYSEIVETVYEGPIEGIQSTGANKLQTIWFAIVPQVFLPFISYTVYRWDTNVRMATIVGLVGGGGIGNLLNMYQGQAMWSELGCVIVVITFVVWAMDTISAYLREALK
jgi:phosphonate transport system permease protein